jgi:hypothetical protein
MVERTLTPALSHPMGEGEFFSTLISIEDCLEFRRAEIAGMASKKKQILIAVPSPIGWERVRVRVF